MRNLNLAVHGCQGCDGDGLPPGYEIQHVPRAPGRGGGVSAMHNSSLTIKPLTTALLQSFKIMLLKTQSGSIVSYGSAAPTIANKKNKFAFAVLKTAVNF